MQIHADTTLIEAARRIAPVIREHNQEAERERRLSPPVLAALHEAGLLRMFTPRSLGGLETDPLTRALVTEEISGHDTAAGWTLFNPLDWAYLCARLPDEGAEEIYGRGANLVIAAQFGRPMQAAPVQDGYRITGRAPFVSNCHDANWIATSAVIAGDQTRPDDKGEPALVMVYLPRESCQVIDTWHVIGMRGTGSNDVAVTDVFVPTARTFPIVPEFTPGSHYRGPLYRFPIIGISASSLPPLILAVARRAIDEVSTLAQGKVPVARSTPLRERASTQAKLARAEAATATEREARKRAEVATAALFMRRPPITQARPAITAAPEPLIPVLEGAPRTPITRICTRGTTVRLISPTIMRQRRTVMTLRPPNIVTLP